MNDNNDIMTIQNVRAYLDKETGLAQISLEDAARGLGFTRDKNGAEYILWDRVNGYLEEFGFFHTSGERVQAGSAAQLFIPENIFYRLAMKAKNETAEQFQAKVADEILPTIRKHGAYMTPAKLEEVLLNPDTLIKLAQNLKDEREKVKQLQAAREADKPKVAFADALTASDTSISLGDMAKILQQNGAKTGRTRLAEDLRKKGLFLAQDWNHPSQAAMSQGLFELTWNTVATAYGSIQRATPRVTPKGQKYLLEMYTCKGKTQ